MPNLCLRSTKIVVEIIKAEICLSDFGIVTLSAVLMQNGFDLPLKRASDIGCFQLVINSGKGASQAQNRDQ